MTFIDSNIPMHLVGAMHPHKADAQQLVARCVSRRERLVTDAEVLQEILHRYVASSRRDAIQPCFDAIHLAVMQRHKIQRIMSFAFWFDGIPGVERLHA